MAAGNRQCRRYASPDRNGSSNGVVGFLPKNEDGVTVFTSCRQGVAESLVGNLNTANGPDRDRHDQRYWHNLLLFVRY